MKMKRMNETVLYYTPEHTVNAAKLKGVLVRMGIRIKNIAPEQVSERVGSLLGLAGFERAASRSSEPPELPEPVTQPGPLEQQFTVTEEMLVMHNFSGSRLDELLLNLRKAGVPKINLKAVVTESNVSWTFYELYKEIREEHEKMEEVSR